MKGLFLFQRRFAIIGNAIAENLHKKYGWSDFCGYVYLRSSLTYLQKQTNIHYSKLLLDEDLHNEYKHEVLDMPFLETLEKEYGIPTLWPFITVDRVVMHNQLAREYPYNTPPYSHEEMLRIVQVKAKAILKLFDEEKPDYVFMSVVGAIGSSLMYYIAKKRGIPVLNTVVGRLGNNFLLSENYYDASFADKLFDQFQAAIKTPAKAIEATQLIEQFRAKPFSYYSELTPAKQAVSRRKQLAFLTPRNAARSIRWFFLTALHFITDKHRSDYQTIKPWFYVWDRLKRKTRAAIGFDDLYDKLPASEPYAFFPLHFDPEIATMLYAPFFTDQAYVIRQIARSLPVGYKLYVKEHPAMAGYRPRAYYKELKKIPNVRLVNPNVPSFDLARKAQLVTTITGTVGWEALLLGKPVITFGDVYYNKLSMVKRCRTIEELPYLVKAQLETFLYNEQEMIHYVAAMLEDGADVRFLDLWEKELGNATALASGTAPIAELIYSKLTTLATR